MSYNKKKKAAIEQFKLIKAKGGVSLKPKFTSHFFRKRKKTNKLDLTNFNQVISVDTKTQTAEVEGLTTFHDIAEVTLKSGLLPLVVPELRNITIGGAISGLGVESSSFRYGLVHDSIIECDVLTGSGEVITCSRTKNSELFFVLPNSLGTVGYILKCKLKLRAVKNFVHLMFLRFDNSYDYFKQLEKECDNTSTDFIDGIIFSNEHFVIVKGKFSDNLPNKTEVNDFKTNIYWKFIEDKKKNDAYLSTWDYLWRWDADVFWGLHGSPLEFTESPLFRKTFGTLFLRSDLLTKINHIYHDLLYKIEKDSLKEDVLQDACIDIAKCSKFLNWHDKTISTYPVWICPVKNSDYDKEYTLHKFKGTYLVDVGIYKGKNRPSRSPENYYNRLLEKEVLALKGMKGLYSVSYFTEKEFWSMYNHAEYLKVKSKYDPNSVFPNLYSKVVGKVTL